MSGRRSRFPGESSRAALRWRSDRRRSSRARADRRPGRPRHTAVRVGRGPDRWGSMIAWTSPRTTKLLHEPGELACLGDVIGICHQGAASAAIPAAAPLARGSLGNGLARRLGTSDTAPPSELVESGQPFGPRLTTGEQLPHNQSVAQNALHCAGSAVQSPVLMLDNRAYVDYWIEKRRTSGRQRRRGSGVNGCRRSSSAPRARCWPSTA